MANPNKPAGLAAVKYFSGAPYTGGGNMYYIANDNTDIFAPGDLVTLTGDGDPKRGIPGIALATAGNPAVGVFLAGGINPDSGAYVNPNNLNNTIIPSVKAQGYYCLVVDDPNVIFEIQEGGSGTNLASTAIGSNANILYTAPSGSQVLSQTVMNNVGVANTATLNLRIFGLVRRVDNGFVTTPSTGGGAQKWWVYINSHCYKSGVQGF